MEVTPWTLSCLSTMVAGTSGALEVTWLSRRSAAASVVSSQCIGIGPVVRPGSSLATRRSIIRSTSSWSVRSATSCG